MTDPRPNLMRELVTLGHIRAHGCRDLLIYGDFGRCHHSATMPADWLTRPYGCAVPLPPNGLYQVRND